MTAAGQATRLPRQRRAQARIVGVEQLLFHPRNVRAELGDLRALAASIAMEGVLVPVMAECRGDTLRLLHGHRRVAAARLAGLRRVPCIVVGEHDDDEAITVMLTENLNRAGLSREEKRAAVRALRDEFGHTVDAIAARLGVSTATVYTWSKDPDWRDRKPHSAATRRRQASRVGPSRVYELCQRWDGHAPAGLLTELRGLIGDWAPAERPRDKRRDGTTAVRPDLIERVASQDHDGVTATQIADRLGVSPRHVARARRAIREGQP